MGLLLPIIVGGLTFFAAKSIIAAKSAIGLAFSNMLKTGSLLPPPLNIAAYIAGGAAIAAGVAQSMATSKKMNDGIVSPGGITTMMGPAGVFSLNPRDLIDLRNRTDERDVRFSGFVNEELGI